MNSLISAIKAFVLKNRPAYKDYLGNGKYDIKKLPEECVPDSVNNNIKNAKSKADSAYDTADAAYSEAESAYDKATLAYDKALDVNSRLLKLTNLNYNFGTLEYTRAKSEKVYAWSIRTDGISDIPLVESKAPMKCNFDILLKDSNNNQIGKYSAFDKKIVRGITKISETYRSFIDERTKIGSDGYAELKIGYEFKNDDNLWHRSIYVNVKLPSADINNANISSVFLHAWSSIVDVDNYAPWPSICVPLAGTNDAGVVYASDKTDDQTVPVSIDKNGYLWCKGSETTVTVGTVTTGEPGTDAAVTNAGTSAAAVLNFVIPRGEKGETGTTGEAGYTPVKGVDYFTDAEKSEIIQAVLDTLPKDGNPGDILVKTETGSEWQYIPDVLKPIIIEAEVNMSNGTVNLTADGISKMNTLDSRYENGNPCPAYLHYALNGANVYTALIFSQLRNYYFRKDYTVSIYVVPDTKNGWILITEPKT